MEATLLPVWTSEVPACPREDPRNRSRASHRVEPVRGGRVRRPPRTCGRTALWVTTHTAGSGVSNVPRWVAVPGSVGAAGAADVWDPGDVGVAGVEVQGLAVVDDLAGAVGSHDRADGVLVDAQRVDGEAPAGEEAERVAHRCGEHGRLRIVATDRSGLEPDLRRTATRRRCTHRVPPGRPLPLPGPAVASRSGGTIPAAGPSYREVGPLPVFAGTPVAVRRLSSGGCSDCPMRCAHACSTWTGF